MTKFLLIFISLVFTLPVTGQEAKKLWDKEEISDISVLLYREDSENSSKTGTATLITSSNRFFLLTAAHVSKSMDQRSKVVFHLDGDLPLIKDLKKLSRNIIVSWKEHDEADIAMIELKLPRDSILKKRFLKLAFPFEQIQGAKNLPPRHADLTFLGYPVLDLELEHFSPLTFEAYLSSGLITQYRYDIKNKKSSFFFLSEPSIQGCSGSGVFYSVKEKGLALMGKMTVLVGIMHGTKSDNTGGKLAAITPSYYIPELLKSF